MEVQTKRAGTGDAASLALLGRITFAETFGYLFRDHPGDLRAYLDATFAAAKIARSLGKPENTYWLALRDGLPVGYAKLKHPSPFPGNPAGTATAQLQKIYVLREFFGLRLGRGLMRDVIDAAAARASCLWLDVLEENERAIGFYEKHGFAQAGEDTYAIGAQHFRFRLMARRFA